MKYFTNTENATTWAQKSSYMPVRKSAYNNLKSDFYVKNPDQQVGISMVDNLFALPFLSTYEDQRTALGNELGNIWNKRKSVKQGLDDAANKCNDIMATG
jgi:ABC-type glycerol-3-phosphate transport system substrate-binding protein